MSSRRARAPPKRCGTPDTSSHRPIIAVDIERGAVAAGPAGKREQACGIFFRFGRRGEEKRANGAGIGEAHAGDEASTHGGGIQRGEHEPAILAADERKRPVNRKGLAVPHPASAARSAKRGARRKPYATSRNSTVQLRAGAMPRQRSSVRCQAGGPGAAASKAAPLLRSAATRQRVRVPGSPFP